MPAAGDRKVHGKPGFALAATEAFEGPQQRADRAQQPAKRAPHH